MPPEHPWNKFNRASCIFPLSVGNLPYLLNMENLDKGKNPLSSAIFHNSGIGIALMDLQLKILLANPALEKLLGYQSEELNGMALKQLIFPDDIEMESDPLWTISNTEPNVFLRTEKRYVRKDGQLIWGRLTATLIDDDKGAPQFGLGMFEDITEQKLSEKAQDILFAISLAAGTAQTQEDLFKQIHEILGQLFPVDNFFIALYDDQKDELSFPYFVDQFDDTPAPKHPGNGLTDFVLRIGESLLASPEVFDRLVLEGEVAEFGSPSIDWMGVPLKISSKTIGVMVAQSYTEGIRFTPSDLMLMEFVSAQVARAIDRKRAEDALKDEEEKYRVLFETSQDAIFLQTLDGRILDCNTIATKMYGYDKATLKTLEVKDLVPAKMLKDRIALDKMLAEQGGYVVEVVNKRRDGSQFPIELSAKLASVGDQCLVVVYVRDITERKRYHRELEAIAKMSTALQSAVTRAEVQPIIREQVAELLDADGLLIAWNDPSTREVVIRVASGAWSELAGQRLPPGDGICGTVIASGKPFLKNHIESDIDIPFIEMGTQISLIACVPLAVQGQILGAIAVGVEKGFDEGDLQVLIALSDLAAGALQGAELLEKTRVQANELGVAYDATIEGWARAQELRDKETQGHAKRVMQMTLQLARTMGVNEGDLEQIRRGALLHDIGKMAIPDLILLKPGKLTSEEWDIMRKHPQYAYDLLYPIPYLRPALDIPYCHHERWNGEGYPNKLKGEEIPLAARIFAVIDVWDALTSDRPYRKAWSQEEALTYIRDGIGELFDPKVVEVFLALIEKGEL
jgi:PAS domain S-box-containing protein/putative nucleotidyltransferase with HDIG domain